MRNILVATFLLFFWFAAHLTAGENKPAKTVDPLVGTWRGYLSQGNQVWQYMMVIRGKGPLFSGAALGWRALPEEIGMSGRPGPQPKEYPLGCSYGETLSVKRDGARVLLQGGDLKILIPGASNILPDALELTEVEPGLLVGQFVRAKDKEKNPSQVLLCSSARWEKPSLPSPPVGATTSISCVGTSYHYRVYVPKLYDPAKPMPLVMHFSPGGNAAPLSTNLAEEFGWIMVGLTESKNGPWEPIGQNREAALMDLRQRLAVDWRRVVFAGDSGGARASARSQVMYPDLCAGLLMSIAGYEQEYPPEKRVPVFFITGDADFNLKEILACFEHSKSIGRNVEMIRHQGDHTNGGPANIETALRWLHGHLGPYSDKSAAPVNKR